MKKFKTISKFLTILSFLYCNYFNEKFEFNNAKFLQTKKQKLCVSVSSCSYFSFVFIKILNSPKTSSNAPALETILQHNNSDL